MQQLTTLQVEALKEISNIGAGHAATALSRLLDHTIQLEPPKAEWLDFSELEARVGSKKHFAVLNVYVLGDIPGRLLVMFDHRNTLQFAADAKLRMAAAIVASSYIDALGELTRMKMTASKPSYTYGSLREIFETEGSAASPAGVFFVESTFLDRGETIYGHVIFVPDAGSLEPLLAAFGV